MPSGIYIYKFLDLEIFPVTSFSGSYSTDYRDSVCEGSNWRGPLGIAIDSIGDLYVTDANSMVRKLYVSITKPSLVPRPSSMTSQRTVSSVILSPISAPSESFASRSFSGQFDEKTQITTQTVSEFRSETMTASDSGTDKRNRVRVVVAH
jgi:hypothetical protein